MILSAREATEILEDRKRENRFFNEKERQAQIMVFAAREWPEIRLLVEAAENVLPVIDCRELRWQNLKDDLANAIESYRRALSIGDWKCECRTPSKRPHIIPLECVK